MKADYVNPFVKSAIMVLEQYIPNIEIERGDLDVVEPPYQSLGAATYLGITGDLDGRVIYDMSRDTAKKVAGTMNGEEFDELNDMVRSTIQEVGNMVTGNASTNLQQSVEASASFDISPPSMIVGEETEISDQVNNNLLQIPLHTNLGDIIINIIIEKN